MGLPLFPRLHHLYQALDQVLLAVGRMSWLSQPRQTHVLAATTTTNVALATVTSGAQVMRGAATTGIRRVLGNKPVPKAQGARSRAPVRHDRAEHIPPSRSWGFGRQSDGHQHQTGAGHEPVPKAWGSGGSAPELAIATPLNSLPTPDGHRYQPIPNGRSGTGSVGVPGGSAPRVGMTRRSTAKLAEGQRACLAPPPSGPLLPSFGRCRTTLPAAR
jgi:hypothetical protein